MEEQTRIAGVMIGAIGAGKSAVGKKIAAEKNLKYIDPDTYWDRKQKYTPEIANEIFAKAFGEIYKCIKTGQSFLLNTASRTHIARREFVRAVRAHAHGTPQYNFKVVGFFVDASLKTCLERNAKRAERRPDKDVIDYYNFMQKELPDQTIDEYDELVLIKNDDYNPDYTTDTKDIKFDKKNPDHAQARIDERFDLCIHVIEVAASRAKEGWNDELIEREIIGAISERFPEDSFLGEETGQSVKNSDFLWIIDPIDGTKNYLDGLEFYGISIALLKNDECILSAVKIPSSNELFARRQDNKIIIPLKKKNNARRLVLISGKTDLRSKEIVKLLGLRETFSPRVLGSVTYSLMEFLKGNARAVLLNDTENWDVIGSLYILQGLGAIITDKKGEIWNPRMQDKKDFIISWDRDFIDFYLDLVDKSSNEQ